MKQLYRVERATEENYHRMMSGSLNYSIEKLDLEAETPEEAAKMAEEEGYVVNKEYVKTVAELEAKEAAFKARMAKERAKADAKAARAKARKAEREAAKAAELGVTVDEYKAMVKREKYIKALTADLEAAKAEVARLEKLLAKA